MLRLGHDEAVIPQPGAQRSLQRLHPQMLQRRRCAAEDAVHRVEDGDCWEAAEEPPELISGVEGEEIYILRSRNRRRLPQRY